MSTLLSLVVTVLVFAIPSARLEATCYKGWDVNDGSCYKFSRSPVRTRQDALETCQDFSADLLSINSVDEHAFIMRWLKKNDPREQRWYTGAEQQTSSVWINRADGSILLDSIFLPGQENVVDKNFAAYEYSDQYKRWGLRKVSGVERLPFVCEIGGEQQTALAEKLFQQQQRDHWYGRQLPTAGRFQPVPRGPRFVQQPVDTVFDSLTRSEFKVATLRCLAEGLPFIEYDWYKSALSGDPDEYQKIDPLTEENSRITISGGALLISDPQQDVDRGVYQCRAYNKFGTVVSRSVQLSFAMIGEFTQQRSLEDGFASQGKVISCNAPHSFPDALYQWSRDSFNNFVERSRRVFVSNNGNLYFAHLERADSGRYMCSVRTSVTEDGKNGPLFPLRVRQTSSPESLRFPQDFPAVFPESPLEGDTVRLECIAYGFPVPSYNWSRADDPDGGLPLGAVISDHNRVLTLPDVTVSDQGVYQCTATNEQSQSRNVTLTIKAKPRFTIPLDDRHADENSDVTWVCEAFGIPEVTYTWLRNGVTMRPQDYTRDPRIEIRDSRLTIRNVSVSDEAMYQCRAANQLSANYSSAQLRVLSLSPSFSKRPLEALVLAAAGRNVTVACQPEAAPAAKIEWQRDGSTIGPGGRVQILSNGFLRLDPVLSDDAGVYTCVATNRHGEASSSTTLKVLEPPVMQQRPVSPVVVVENAWPRMQCRASSGDRRLDIAYDWFHNQLPIDFDRADSRFRRIDKDGGIEIRNTTENDAGLYSCVAHTTVGAVNSSTELRVVSPPEAPGGVRVSNINATSVLLTWHDFDDNGRKIGLYRIQARTNWQHEWFIVVDNVTVERNQLSTSSFRSYHLYNKLAPNSRYEFRVAAANPLGYGPFSPASPSSLTVPAPPSVAPRILPGGGGMSGDLHIRWERLSEKDRNAEGVYYKVFWKRTGLRPEQLFNFKDLRSLGDIDYYVTSVGDRYFYTLYKVKIQAFNSMGPGPISAEADVYSAEGMPNTVPTNVEVRPYNSTALNVSWSGIELGRNTLRGNLVGYRVKYWPFNGNEATDSLIRLSPGPNTSALVLGLKPYTQYYAKVMVYNKAGSGQESESSDGFTYKMAPQSPPIGVTVRSVDPYTLEVKWRMSTINVNEEALLGFKIRVWELGQDMSEARDTLVPLGIELRARVTDLEPGQTYFLRVLAYSLGGDGSMSSPVQKFKLVDDTISSATTFHHWNLLMLFPLVLAMAWLQRQGAF